MSRAEDPPPRGLLAGLAADDWALLLTSLRSALSELGEDDQHPQRQLVRSFPTGKLAGGSGRDRAVDLIASDPALWGAIRDGLAADPRGVEVLAGLEGPTSLSAGATSDDASRPPAEQRARDQAYRDAKRRSQRDRERLTQVRSQRDEARRRADLAERRARALEAELGTTQERIGTLERRIAQLNAEVEAADRERERAVQRERRRGESDVDALREELGQLRRDEQRRRERDRRREDRERAETSRNTVGDRGRAAGRGSDAAPPRLVPGRPSELPSGVDPNTREAVDLYLHRGRRVLVDGYNVTLQRHPGLDLEQQRTWLVGAVANLARSRGIRPTVVFDGGRSEGQQRGSSGGREVAVRFSDPGITADDEIVLEVEATDDPIVVVTDDRELSARVRMAGADVIGSSQLLWVL